MRIPRSAAAEQGITGGAASAAAGATSATSVTSVPRTARCGRCIGGRFIHGRDPGTRRFAPASTLPRVPRARRSLTLYRPALRACVPAAVLLAVPASLAFAKPSFETGPYYGNVAVKSKPVVRFTAARKRVKELDVDSQQVTCADGGRGALNLPGTPETVSYTHLTLPTILRV